MLVNLDQIRKAAVHRTPYPYFVVAGALFAESAEAARGSFPRVDRPGAVAVDDTSYGPEFAELLAELRGDRFRDLIARKLEIELAGRSTIINVRGLTRWTDGNIHTDTPSKLVTVLLYFNAPGEAAETGLRILRNGRDLDDYVEEVPPLLGNMLAFKVTPNCWHGHKPFAGQRHSLQLNYLSGRTTIGKHQLAHRLIGRMKRKLARI